MKFMRAILAISMATGLVACAETPDYVTRAATPETTLLNSEAAGNPAALSASYKVVQLNVDVPRSLKVSEANSFYPGGDIVWRGDPFGDRYAQIEAIFRDGMGKGIEGLGGAQEVIVDIEIERFHSVTERTRYTVGGVHSIRFAMTVRDAASGAVIEPRRVVQSDLNAFGGMAAVAAEAKGQSQKVRVTDHLSKVIFYEMTRARDFLRV